jgi:hypothetical protein
MNNMKWHNLFDWIMETKEKTEPVGTPVKVFRRVKRKTWRAA